MNKIIFDETFNVRGISAQSGGTSTSSGRSRKPSQPRSLLLSITIYSLEYTHWMVKVPCFQLCIIRSEKSVICRDAIDRVRPPQRSHEVAERSGACLMTRLITSAHVGVRTGWTRSIASLQINGRDEYLACVRGVRSRGVWRAGTR